jgi:exosortase D (VPLPA-CTERM-specific)
MTLAAGTIGAELFMTRIALLGTLAGTVVFVWGWRHLKATGFAFLLIALAIPIPAIIFNQIAFPLQLLASRFGEFAISSCQIPVLREGNVITLATTSLEVAEACSGIRSLVSLVTLAVVWGYFTASPMWLRWTLVAASVPIAIFANGTRVAGTGIAAHFIGPAAAEGFFHTFSGWMVFVVAGVLLLLVHRLASWLGPSARPAPPGADGARVGPPEVAPVQREHDTALNRRMLAVFGCLVIMAAALGALTRTEAVRPRQPLSTLPKSVGSWRSVDDSPLDEKVLALLRVDEYVNRAYGAPGRPWVSLYVGYYRSQRQGQTMHSPLNCLPGAGWEPVERGRVSVPAPGGGARPGNAEINRLIIQKGLERELVLYWYQAHGRIVASEYWGKIYTVVDAIRLNRSDASMVRVIVPIPSQDASAEAAAERAALDFVTEILPELSTRLDR